MTKLRLIESFSKEIIVKQESCLVPVSNVYALYQIYVLSGKERVTQKIFVEEIQKRIPSLKTTFAKIKGQKVNCFKDITVVPSLLNLVFPADCEIIGKKGSESKGTVEKGRRIKNQETCPSAPTIQEDSVPKEEKVVEIHFITPEQAKKRHYESTDTVKYVFLEPLPILGSK